MNKKIMAAVLSVGMLINTSVYADVLEQPVVTDVENSVVTVKGNFIDTNEKREYILMVTKDGESFKNGEVYSGKDGYVKLLETEVDGSFEYSFKFTGNTGVYNFYVTDTEGLGQVSENYKQLHFISFDEVIQFVDDLGDGVVPEDEIFEKLSYYADGLGIDTDVFKEQEEKNYVAMMLFDGKDKIKINKIDEVKRLVKLAENQCSFLNSLAKTIIGGEVDTLISNNLDFEKIEVDFTSYTALGDKRTQAAEKLTGIKFETIELFKAALEKAINEVKQSPGGSAGGGISGGGSGGGVSGGVSGGNTTSYTEKEEKEENSIPEQKGFTDISNHSWASDAINALSEKGIISGFGYGLFQPDGEITREQFAKLVVLAFDAYNADAKTTLNDVPVDSWSYSYVASATEEGLILGNDNNNFNGGAPITREDIAVILYRAAQKKGIILENTKESFNDMSQISDYAKDAVRYMAGEGIINGFEDATFRPQEKATRAQAALLIYKMMGGMN